MFIIHTARAGEAYHTLSPIERLIHRDPVMAEGGLELELRVRVAPSAPEAPLTFKYYLLDHDRGLRIEIISLAEMARRREFATENGRVYDEDLVQSLHEGSATLKYARELEQYFRELMDRETFRLPTNV